MRRSLVLLLAAALAILGWFLATREAGRSRVATIEGPAAAAPAPRPAAHAPLVVPVPDPVRLATGAEDRLGADPPRAAAELGHASPFADPVPEDQGLLVRVVHGGTEAPVPHAQVLWIDGERLSEEEGLLLQVRGFELDRIFERHGLRYRADQTGEVLVPRAQGMALIGRKDGLWGMLGVEASASEPVLLPLAPDPALRILVVDGAGAPVGGVPVAMRLRQNERSYFDALLGVTDATGLAVLPHVANLLGTVIDQEALAAIGGALAEPVEAPVDPERLEEPIRLTLPASGGVEVRLVRPDGAPVRATHLLAAGWCRRTEPEASWDRRYARTSKHHLLEIEDGRARLFPVGLDLELEVQLLTAQGSVVAEATVAGPSRAGELVEAVLEVEAAPALRARLLDAEGRPLAGKIVQLSLEDLREGERTELDRARLATDAEGRVRYEVGEEHAGMRWLGFRTLPGAGPEELHGEVELAGGPLLGDEDLGDVVLSAAPRIVAGIVVDETGTPIPGAQVHVRPLGASGKEHAPLRCTTDGQGRFDLRGAVAHERLRIWAFHPGHVMTPPADHQRGAADVRIVLHSGGSLVARVTWDEGLDPELRVRLVKESSDGDRDQRLEEEGTVEFGSLLPGRYELLVQLEDADEVLARVPDLLVAARAETDAGTIDLRGVLRSLLLTVVDEGSRPLRAAVYRLEERAAGAGRRSEGTGTDGRLRLATSREGVDVLVTADDHRPALLTLRGDETVVLRAGLPLRLRLRGGLPALEPDEMLLCRLSPLEVSSPEAARSSLERLVGFDEHGVADVRAPAAGAWRAQLLVRLHRVGRTSLHAVGDELRIELAEGGAAPEVELVLDRARLEALRGGG